MSIAGPTRAAQRLDGWDAMVKVSALASVLMDYPLKPQDIKRECLRGLAVEQVQPAALNCHGPGPLDQPGASSRA